MPDNTPGELLGKGFDVLGKAVDKTSHKYKIFNIVPLGIIILIIFLMIFLIDAFVSELDKTLITMFFITAMVIIIISAAGFLLQDFLDIKRIQIQQAAHNQQFKQEYQ